MITRPSVEPARHRARSSSRPLQPRSLQRPPTGLTAQWQVADPSGTTDTIIATWNAALPGNSPVDEYEIVINGSDGAGTSTQTVSGTTLTAYFNVDSIPNWTVTVRAHNAAGWSPWSTPFTLAVSRVSNLSSYGLCLLERRPFFNMRAGFGLLFGSCLPSWRRCNIAVGNEPGSKRRRVIACSRFADQTGSLSSSQLPV